MGIDVYLRWEGQTKAEKDAQYTGYSVVHGHIGYLREAYHGEPYATSILIPEGDQGGEITIPAATLRDRLPAALRACEERYRDEPTLIPQVKESFTQFVELAERKEQETGTPIRVYVSG